MTTLRNKKVAVLGLLDPGVAAIRLVSKEGGKIKAFGIATEKEIKRIQAELKGISFEIETSEPPPDALLDFQQIILTPGGGRRYQKQIEAAKKKGIPVLTDLELALERYKSPVIAVTGTNGKSSVVDLIRQAIEASGKKALVAGGDYQDFCDSVLKTEKYDWVVLELNSSRLSRANTVKPHIAVLLNIYSGHSERHKNFSDYVDAKAKIFIHQTQDDFFVYQKTTGFIDKVIAQKGCQAQLVPFSFGLLEEGVFLRPDEKLIVARLKQKESRFSYLNFGLTGTHNVENAMAAVAVAKICGLSDPSIQQMLDSARPLPDRMELVQKIGGVSYFNDAKSVNSVATASSLHCFEDKGVILIAGGTFSPHSKNRFLVEMFSKKVKCLILFGDQRRDFYKNWGDSTESYVVPELKDAVELAYQKAGKGDVVLFSPAARPELHVHGSTQKRGAEFRRLVKELSEMEKAKQILTRRI